MENEEVVLTYGGPENPVSETDKIKLLKGDATEKLTFLLEENIPGIKIHNLETYHITLPNEYEIVPIRIGKYDKNATTNLPGRPSMRQVTVTRGLVSRLNETPRYFVIETDYWSNHDDNLIVDVVAALDKELT